ncbi:MAG: DUF1553 domain-containing protein, partial [Pirellulales bacterium]|nr:DUF1553 domain-containing protein [Pirellulales bacterium]
MSRSRYRCVSLVLAVSGAVAIFWLAVQDRRQAVADDASTGSTARGPDAAPIRFSRDIRPILSQNCFLCHGQDESRRGGGLRLDVPELAVAELDSGARAIVPGKPHQSELVARITAEDDSLRMPPEESHKTLTTRQIELLTQWVADGAKYEAHWSFIPPQRPGLPARADRSASNPIDGFVHAKLAQERLSWAPSADKRTLIRRVTLDLTGLPPTPEEIASFLADERPDAYERLVDRLLASPQYGERMAMDWLDAARYADTHGYHIDSHRDMWAWRDWVINAFNENLPFDKFTVWQLAGDLLPEATVEQQVASGFNRNHPINFEGGAIPEEYHVEYVVDRATTTGTVWMGLTLGCARCHDHKYDPITQTEFFRMFAFFNNVDEAGLDGYRGNAQPMLELPSDEQRRAVAHLNDEIKRLEETFAEREAKLVDAQNQWETQRKEAPVATRATPTDWVQWGPVAVDTPELGLATTFDISTPVRLEQKYRNEDGEHRWLPAPQIVDGKTADFSGDSSVVHLVRQIESADAGAIQASVGTSDAIQLWLNGKLIFERREQQAFSPRQQVIELPLAKGANELLVKLVNYGWEWQFHLAFDPESKLGPAPNVEAILALASEKRSADQKSSLQAYFRANQLNDAEYQGLATDLANRRAELAAVTGRIPSTMVMRELADPRKSFRLDRGQYSSPAEEVTPGVPAALPALPKDAPANRLTLARWLVSREHPLTARVTVNRLWQALFGTGLVKTSEDFGLQGQFPANPDLLDWLAVEFIDSGWDVKHILRLVVTSDAYRQSSAASAELIARDPDNQLLARGPRFRMSAELIRDLALSTSGLLDGRIGGPSVTPYQPGDLWGELAHQKHNYKFSAQLFEQDHGDDLYRRSMYTFWKRSVPPPNLTALDAPSREVCTVRRERTNTPLQALVLLNDPTFVEAARQLAERMMHECDDPAACIQFAFELATARIPSDREAAILRAEYEKQLASFAQEPSAAAALLAVGESPRDATLDAVVHAAWTNVALVILNLDESVT